MLGYLLLREAALDQKCAHIGNRDGSRGLRHNEGAGGLARACARLRDDGNHGDARVIEQRVLDLFCAEILAGTYDDVFLAARYLEPITLDKSPEIPRAEIAFGVERLCVVLIAQIAEHGLRSQHEDFAFLSMRKGDAAVRVHDLDLGPDRSPVRGDVEPEL